MRHWGVNTNTSKTTENNRKLCCDCPARRLDEYGCCKGVQGPSSGVHLCVPGTPVRRSGDHARALC